MDCPTFHYKNAVNKITFPGFPNADINLSESFFNNMGSLLISSWNQP